ncbi:hypothetical protein MPTK1_8g12830 [Marchantia polymorpha subsp. ruderalis]|uniref:Sec-independent protein translocase protein TATB, chloroplastic n=2 Tax=Marchantia polymorpha TaxID=3197 RepID=A0A176WMV6_MARPO|nr:hypothetical protein AXG93_3472s1130 [Marchantia polymorpha subsp. ruderalis]PTQ34072.1 hypothetical protein MARPO_0083s0037 [Marchantia polymorpha]BBN19695.1 hypothetical protein Mp_8g12830 [Marchantia polymorpha subsp. ruderalis]|eukprot:PTQ34072.1 hypothetical protein MARPO_0083s0037 [Marchantia polymorpha]
MAMAGAVVVVPRCGTPISSALSGSETSCSSNSSSLPKQASCSRTPSSFHVSVTLSSASPSLLRSGSSYWNSWTGRSHLGNAQLLKVITGRQQLLSKQGIVGRVHASLLGVGAPEALVIAVVALLVFGPKGLAEVARTLGKSLKAFQPTIQELQQVSREFRSTLEQEIGLDELRNPKPLDPPSRPKSESPITGEMPQDLQQPSVQSSQIAQPPTIKKGPEAYTTEDYVRVTAEQAKSLVPEDLRKEAERAAWGGSPPPPPTDVVEDKEATGPAKPEEKKSEEISL